MLGSVAHGWSRDEPPGAVAIRLGLPIAISAAASLLLHTVLLWARAYQTDGFDLTVPISSASSVMTVRAIPIATPQPEMTPVVPSSPGAKLVAASPTPARHSQTSLTWGEATLEPSQPQSAVRFNEPITINAPENASELAEQVGSAMLLIDEAGTIIGVTIEPDRSPKEPYGEAVRTALMNTRFSDYEVGARPDSGRVVIEVRFLAKILP